jgi:tetratricopeptide (TPR) repeat protein
MKRISIALLLIGLLVATAGCGGSEARKGKAMERGQQLYAQRDYARARVEFRNALQIDPKDAAAWTLLGETNEALGNHKEAVDSYRNALDLDQGQLRARARLGRMMVFGGLPDQALETIEPGLVKNPQSADLLAVRAAVRQQQGDDDAARKDAEAAVAAQPNHPDATALLATLAWREGRRDEALAMLDKALEASPDEIMLRHIYAQLLLAAEKPELAEVQLKEVVRLDPGTQGNRYKLAQLQASEKKFDEAVATLRDAIRVKPEDVEAKLALATLLAAQGSFEDAEKELLGFIKASPKDLDLRLGVARFYDTNGNHEQAEAMYRDVMKDSGDKAVGVTARGRLASLMVRTGRTEEGARLADDVLAKNPSDADALVLRAQLAIQRGDPDAAIADLRTALRDQPTNVLLIVQLAQAYIRAGDVALAEQTLRQAVKANPRDTRTRLALAQFLVNKGEATQARPVLEQLVKDEPSNMEALEGYAKLLLMLNDPAGALQAATTLQSLQPKSATGFYLAGLAQQSLQRTDEARRSFEAALAADPAALEPLVALAQLDVAAGDNTQALARIDGRMAAQPQDPRLHNLRGELLMAMRSYSDAEASYGAAAKLQPTWPQPYRGQAGALVAAGKTDRAIEVLKGALGTTGNSSEIAVDLGALYTNVGRTDDAIAVYERVLQRDPNNLVVANNLAMLLVSNRGDAASLERAGKLTERFANSDNPAFLDTHGWVLYKLGRYLDAIVPLARAVARAPQAQEIRYHLGMAQLKAGKAADARKSLEDAVNGDQDYPGKDEARSALAGM